MSLAITKRWRLSATFAFALAMVATVIGWHVMGTRTPSKPSIDFTPVPIAAARAVRADLAPDDMIDFVDVRRVDFAVRGDLTEDVWNTFGNNPHERSFRNVVVTKESFSHVLTAYQARLIAKASALGLAPQTLTACLDSIEPTGYLAVLPVGAYLAKHTGEDIWILVCKWENMSRDGPVHLSHVRVWALRAADHEILAFQTCM